MTARSIVHGSFHLERTYPATPARVFRAFADPAAKAKWFGSLDGWAEGRASMDFRVGGLWSAHIVMELYGDARMGGRYLEIEPGRRIVKTFQWRNGEDDPETVITLGFYDLGDGRTRQTFHQTPFTNVPRRDSHIDGWTQSFNTEQAYVEAQAREPAP